MSGDLGRGTSIACSFLPVDKSANCTALTSSPTLDEQTNKCVRKGAIYDVWLPCSPVVEELGQHVDVLQMNSTSVFLHNTFLLHSTTKNL